MACTIDLDGLLSYPVFTSLFALFHVQLGHLFHALGSIKSNIPRPLVSHMTLCGWQRRIKLQSNLKTSTKKNQDDLSAFRSKPLIRRRKKDSISPPTAPNQIVICPLSRWVWSNVGKVTASLCRLMYFISTSCCYKFIIYPSGGLFTLPSYAPTTQSPWQQGSQASGRGEVWYVSCVLIQTLSPQPSITRLLSFTHSH